MKNNVIKSNIFLVIMALTMICYILFNDKPITNVDFYFSIPMVIYFYIVSFIAKKYSTLKSIHYINAFLVISAVNSLGINAIFIALSIFSISYLAYKQLYRPN